jgi:hypothetical protein
MEGKGFLQGHLAIGGGLDLAPPSREEGLQPVQRWLVIVGDENMRNHTWRSDRWGSASGS